jgi:hypothetical protein
VTLAYPLADRAGPEADPGSRPARLRDRLGDRCALVLPVLGLAVGAGTVLAPWLVAGLVAAAAVAVAVRWPFNCGLVLIVAAPCLFAEIPLGALSLDNYATLAGMLVVGIAAFITRRLPLSALSVFPLAVAAAVGLTGLGTGVDSLDAVIRFVGLALAPWLAVRCEGGVRFTRAVVRLVVLAVALSVLVQPWTRFPAPVAVAVDGGGDGFRYGGLLGHPNFTAYSLALVALAVIAQRRITRSDAVLLVAVAPALLMTGSVAAIGFAGAAALVVLARHPRRLLAAVGLGCLGLAAAGRTLIARLGAFQQTGLSGDNSATWRESQWLQALRLTRGHEFAGIGWQQTAAKVANGLQAHSAYVETVVELGILGTLVVLAGLVHLLHLARRSGVAIVLLAYVLVTSISDPTVYYPACLTVLLVLLAATVRTGNHPALPGQLMREHRP